jgi:tetratricopeptide (TPR) repeat protein
MELGLCFYFARRFDEAIDALKKTQEIDPNFPMVYAILALSHVAKDDLAEAVRCVEKPAFVGRFAASLSVRGQVYGFAGRRDDAMRILKELEELAKEEYVSPHHFFAIQVGVGDKDAWRKTLWEAYEQRLNSVVLYKAVPWLDPIRSDPVFQEIIRRVGLP